MASWVAPPFFLFPASLGRGFHLYFHHFSLALSTCAI